MTLLRVCLSSVVVLLASLQIAAAQDLSLTQAIQGVSAASPEDLRAAEVASRAGNATLQQRQLTNQLQMVRQNNDVINRRATIGEVNNATYQKLQRDFDQFNSGVAEKAAQSAGLKYGKQLGTEKPYAPGTDSDYIFHSADPNKPVTPAQIKQAKTSYNTMMNQEFGTQGVNYAKKLDTDLMANPKGISQPDFEAIGHMNNDPYFRRGAADFEAKKRSLQKYDDSIKQYDQQVQDGTLKPNTPDPRLQPRPPEITPRESKAYADEMIEMAGKKSVKIDTDLNKAVAARDLDPTRQNWTDKSLSEKLSLLDDPNRTGNVKDLDAELTTLQQKQAKYVDRLNQETQRMFDEQVKPFVNGAKPPEISDLPTIAANRSIEAPPGGNEAEIVKLRQANAAAANALEDPLLKQAIRNNAEVRAGVASVDPKGSPAERMIADQAQGRYLKDAAELGSRLSPSEQGQLVNDVRAKYGDATAEGLSARMREINTRGTPSEGLLDRLGVGSYSEATEKFGKGMVVIDILNAGQTAVDVIQGKKSTKEGLLEVGDQLTGGLIGVFGRLGDLGRALVAVEKEQNAYREEWIVEIGDTLRDAGVNKTDRIAIMTALGRGDDSKLDAKIKELKDKGVDVKLPDMQTASVEGDESFLDRLGAVPGGVVHGIGRGLGFAYDTAGNLIQLPVLFKQLLSADNQANLNADQAESQFQRLADVLRKLYRDPHTRKIFPDSFTEDEAVYFLKTNLDLGKKPLDGLIDFSKLKQPDPKSVVPDVLGHPMSDAISLIEGRLLTVVCVKGKDAPDEKRANQVYYQDPDPNTEVDLHSEVTIFYYGQAPKESVKIPKLIGMSKEDAEATLAKFQLVPGGNASEIRPPKTAKRHEVFKQNPAPMADGVSGQTVEFEYYAGLPVGRYVGLKKDHAIARIKQDGFTPKVEEGDLTTESLTERFNVYGQTPAPGEYRWFDDPVMAHYYKADRGFQEGDGAFVAGKFKDAKVTDGELPGENFPSAGARTAIYYFSALAGTKETKTNESWYIRKFADSAGAKAYFEKMTKSFKQVNNTPPTLTVQKFDRGNDFSISMDLKTDRNQSSTQVNYKIYRDVFVIGFVHIEPVAGKDFSREASSAMTKSVDLIDIRFPSD